MLTPKLLLFFWRGPFSALWNRRKKKWSYSTLTKAVYTNEIDILDLLKALFKVVKKAEILWLVGRIWKTAFWIFCKKHIIRRLLRYTWGRCNNLWSFGTPGGVTFSSISQFIWKLIYRFGTFYEATNRKCLWYQNARSDLIQVKRHSQKILRENINNCVFYRRRGITYGGILQKTMEFKFVTSTPWFSFAYNCIFVRVIAI